MSPALPGLKYKDRTINMKHFADKTSAADRTEALLTAILNDVTLDFDPQDIDAQVNFMLDDFAQRIAASGITMDEYLLKAQKTRDEIFDHLRVVAAETRKKDLVMTEIAVREDISVTRADLLQKVAEFAALAGKPQDQMYEELAKSGILSNVYKELLWGKVTTLLLQCNSFV